MYHSRFIIPVSLDCKYLERQRSGSHGSVSFIRLHVLVFPSCSCVLQSFFLTSICPVSSIVQGSTLGVFDKKTGAYRDQNSFLDGPISSSHTFLHQIPHTQSIFLHLLCIHVQCFCLSCGAFFLAYVSLVKSVILLMRRERISVDMGRVTTTHISIDTFP